jgi:hypothetical protein
VTLLFYAKRALKSCVCLLHAVPTRRFRNTDSSASLRTAFSGHDSDYPGLQLHPNKCHITHNACIPIHAITFTVTRDAALDLYLAGDIVYWYYHPGLTVRLRIWRLPYTIRADFIFY